MKTSRGITEATKEMLIFYILIRTMIHRCVNFVKFTKLPIYDLCMLYFYLKCLHLSYLFKCESDYIIIMLKTLQSASHHTEKKSQNLSLTDPPWPGPG